MAGSRRGSCRPIEILLVEDNPGDVRLTNEALKEGKVLSFYVPFLWPTRFFLLISKDT